MGAGSGGKVRQLLPPGTRWPPAAPGTAPCTPAAGSSSPAPACGDGMGWDQGVLCFGGQEVGRGSGHQGSNPLGHLLPLLLVLLLQRIPLLLHAGQVYHHGAQICEGQSCQPGGTGAVGMGPHVAHPYLCPGVSWPLSAAPAEPLCPAGPPRSSAAGRMPVETQCLLWSTLAPRGAPNHPVPQTSHSTGHPCTSSLA